MAADKIRMKITVVGYYLADPQYYDGETDPHKMAELDAKNIGFDPIEAAAAMDEEEEFEIKVEPA